MILLTVATACYRSEATALRTDTDTDTDPPGISAVAVTDIGENVATVTWTTDEPADARVEYGASSTYASQTSPTASLDTTHAVELTALASSAVIHFRVRSSDAAGNEAVSDDAVFATLGPAGSLDTTFDGDGIVTTEVNPGLNAHFRTIAVLPNGAVIGAGYFEQDMVLARYDSGGGLDTTFGTSGLVVVDVGGLFEPCNDVMLHSDGSIVCITGSLVIGASIVRVDGNGGMVTGFGVGGITSALLTPNWHWLSGVAELGTDLITVGGTEYDGYSIARWDAAGALVPTFGGNGWRLGSVAGGDDLLNEVVIDGQGRILACGGAVLLGNDDLLLARFNPSDGSRDLSFGVGGVATLDVAGGDDWAVDLALLADGRIVVAGGTNRGSGDILLARFLPDGDIDTSFGVDGMVVRSVTPGSNDGVRGFVMQPDGKLLVGGVTGPPGALAAFVARFFADGAPDLAFGPDQTGVVTIDTSPEDDEIWSLAIAPDGRIVAGGSVIIAGVSHVALFRLWP